MSCRAQVTDNGLVGHSEQVKCIIGFDYGVLARWSSRIPIVRMNRVTYLAIEK
jgi:hypothetical protein